MSDDLKPCPFCGGKAEHSIGKTGDGKPWHYVECVDCGATGPTPDYADHNIAVIECRAEAWNTRADRIEELEAEIKLLSEGVTIAHLRGAMDAHANRADDLWAEFKDKWDGERKFALRQIVRWLKNTPGDEAEGE
jgi:Lar family restriction alleviation protein